MELTHDFLVEVEPARAWQVLTDVEKIAPCLPGAQLREIEGEEYRGVVKVKVGPITAQYKGVATFLERDAAAGRAVLRAEGRDVRGQGNANATITMTLAPEGSGTRVSVLTDLAISGKVAQFGRGVMADVSGKLLDQFVDSLGSSVLAPGAGDEVTADPTPAPAPAAASSPADSGRRLIDAPEAVPVDLLQAGGTPVLRRLVPVAGVIAAVVAALVVLRRRRTRI